MKVMCVAWLHSGQSLQKLAWLQQFGIDSDCLAGENHYKLTRVNNHMTNYNNFGWIFIDSNQFRWSRCGSLGWQWWIIITSWIEWTIRKQIITFSDWFWWIQMRVAWLGANHHNSTLWSSSSCVFFGWDFVRIYVNFMKKYDRRVNIANTGYSTPCIFAFNPHVLFLGRLLSIFLRIICQNKSFLCHEKRQKKDVQKRLVAPEKA